MSAEPSNVYTFVTQKVSYYGRDAFEPIPQSTGYYDFTGSPAFFYNSAGGNPEDELFVVANSGNFEINVNEIDYYRKSDRFFQTDPAVFEVSDEEAGTIVDINFKVERCAS